MQKTLKQFKTLFLLLSVSVISLSLCSCQTLNELIYGKFETNDEYVIDMVSETFNLTLTDVTVMEKWDTHGGFHGDGERFVKIHTEQDLSLQMPPPKNADEEGTWNPMPLSSLASGWVSTGSLCEEHIPLESIDYWFFLMDGPFNFLFGSYNKTENTLYYYEWDA